jgi:hypothetical protein
MKEIVMIMKAEGGNRQMSNNNHIIDQLLVEPEKALREVDRTLKMQISPILWSNHRSSCHHRVEEHVRFFIVY